jgi:hypothetical protein
VAQSAKDEMSASYDSDRPGGRCGSSHTQVVGRGGPAGRRYSQSQLHFKDALLFGGAEKRLSTTTLQNSSTDLAPPYEQFNSFVLVHRQNAMRVVLF